MGSGLDVWHNDDRDCGGDKYGVKGRGSFDDFVYPCPELYHRTSHLRQS